MIIKREKIYKKCLKLSGLELNIITMPSLNQQDYFNMPKLMIICYVQVNGQAEPVEAFAMKNITNWETDLN